MRKFLINVNGNQYEVEVEEITSSETSTKPQVEYSQPAPKAERPASQPKQEAKAEAPKKVEAKAGQEVVKAPMPGTILSINVKEGDNVKKGQILLILEAMKMENEIVSPRDGKIAKVVVSKGSSVNTGDDMVIIE